MKHLKSLSLIIPLLLMAAPKESLGTTIRYEFTGYLTSVSYELGSYYSAGQTFSGTVWVDSLNSNPTPFSFEREYIIEYVDYTIGNTSVQNMNVNLGEVGSNYSQQNGDSFGMWINPLHSLVIGGNEWIGLQLQLGVSSSDTTLLTNDTLVTGDIYSLFSGNGYMFMEYICWTCDPFGGEYAYPAYLWGELTSLTGVAAVPLPAGIYLFGSGLLGLAALARRRKN